MSTWKEWTRVTILIIIWSWTRFVESSYFSTTMSTGVVVERTRWAELRRWRCSRESLSGFRAKSGGWGVEKLWPIYGRRVCPLNGSDCHRHEIGSSDGKAWFRRGWTFWTWFLIYKFLDTDWYILLRKIKFTKGYFLSLNFFLKEIWKGIVSRFALSLSLFHVCTKFIRGEIIRKENKRKGKRKKKEKHSKDVGNTAFIRRIKGCFPLRSEKLWSFKCRSTCTSLFAQSQFKPCHGKYEHIHSFTLTANTSTRGFTKLTLKRSERRRGDILRSDEEGDRELCDPACNSVSFDYLWLFSVSLSLLSHHCLPPWNWKREVILTITHQVPFISNLYDFHLIIIPSIPRFRYRPDLNYYNRDQTWTIWKWNNIWRIRDI